MQDKIIELVRDKTVKVCCHWDADGVTSGALIYHMIKPYAKVITTISKGMVFEVKKEDIAEEEVIICADIPPAKEILDRTVIYINHHPSEISEQCTLAIHDDKYQSCSLLIYENVIEDKTNPYNIFLTLLGFFGDAGKRENLPTMLKVNAMNYTPELMEKNKSYYSKGHYLTVEKYVSAMNTGKRMNWSGDIPLELLKCIDHYGPFTENFHPLAQTIQTYKSHLRNLYSQDVEIKRVNNFDMIYIESKKNIQGVLAARNIKEKPIIVINKFQGQLMGSMRVPDTLDFDAGKFLDQFNGKIETFLGGGHEKAGGFTIQEKDFPELIEKIKLSSSSQ